MNKKEYKKQYYQKNRLAISARNLKYRLENRDIIRLRGKKYYQQNKDKIKIYRDDNKERIKEWFKIYRFNNKERLKIQRNNKREKRLVRNKIRYHNDIQYRLASVLRSRLTDAIRNNQKSGSAVRDLGCTIPELKFYIEGKFQDKMSWDNWGVNTWHIDHVIPLAYFDLSNREQFLKAVHYTNLQPMWAIENYSKHDKLLTLETYHQK